MDYELSNYDKRYLTNECDKENQYIKSILEKFIPKGRRVLDIGAGTGLVYSLIGHRNRLISTDKNLLCRRIMRKKFPDDPISAFNMNSTEALDKFFVGQWITCTFALHYFPFKDIIKILLNKSVCVIYNKPYLRKDSVYYGKKWEYLNKNLIADIFIRICLKFIPHHRYRLCDEPYYDVIVTTGNDYAKTEIRNKIKTKKEKNC